MNSAAESMIRIPWGPAEWLPLDVPRTGVLAGAQVEVFEPDLANPVADYARELQQALAAPIATPTLAAQVQPGNRVAIVVDDPSRWTPVRQALEIILPILHERGVSPEKISIVMGVGRHRVVDQQGMVRRLGPEIASSYRCYSPPVDEWSAYVELGVTASGVPVRLFRPVVEADLRILVGSVLPHLQAGFGGGYKLILPGSSHRSTLAAIHAQGLGRGSDASRLLGSHAWANPMRQAIHEAARLLGPCFSLSHLIAAPGRILRVLAGQPAAVQDALAGEAEARFRAPDASPSDLLVVGNHPWPGDPLQSFKALLHHQSACRANGILAGVFWTDPQELDRSAPLGALRLIARLGPAGGALIRLGLPCAQHVSRSLGLRSAFMIRWARELVVDREVVVLAPPIQARLGSRLGPVRLVSSQADLWSSVARSLGRLKREQALRIRVFPWGGLSFAPPSAAESET